MARKEQRLEAMLARAKTEILAGGHFLTPDCLTLRHDGELDQFTMSLKQAEANQRIFSVEHQGQSLYPDYAFSENQGWNLLPGLALVITTLQPTLDGWGMAFWFRSPNSFLGGKRPEDHLHQELEKVLAAAREEVANTMPG